jgi:hypothetical protein
LPRSETPDCILALGISGRPGNDLTARALDGGVHSLDRIALSIEHRAYNVGSLLGEGFGRETGKEEKCRQKEKKYSWLSHSFQIDSLQLVFLQIFVWGLVNCSYMSLITS